MDFSGGAQKPAQTLRLSKVIFFVEKRRNTLSTCPSLGGHSYMIASYMISDAGERLQVFRVHNQSAVKLAPDTTTIYWSLIYCKYTRD